MSDLDEGVLAISSSIRYVAGAHGQQAQMQSRPDLHNASSSDSDLYEELLVNPTLHTLATQRQHRLRWTAAPHRQLRPFHQLVIPRPDGHVSIGGVQIPV